MKNKNTFILIVTTVALAFVAGYKLMEYEPPFILGKNLKLKHLSVNYKEQYPKYYFEDIKTKKVYWSFDEKGEGLMYEVK